MDTTIDIGWFELIVSHLLLIIPLLIFWYYKTKLLKDTIIAMLRMSVQLILVGFYLEYVFRWNNAYINLLWVLIMVIVSAVTITQKTGLKLRFFLVPNFVAIFVSLFVIDFLFLGYIVKLDYAFDARYIIPISGMILGNSMQNNIISLNYMYNDLNKNEIQYQYALACGASFKEAITPYISEGLRKSFNPTIAKTAVMGIISLPGTMTGQIIGGSSPTTAIKYQIMLVLMIFVSSVLSVFLSIVIANRFAFDKYFNLRKEIFVKK
ncbi:MAG TPA: ABC transporter permease [Bacteroidales bacterium]|nr:MAG: ABC transporter permease [Bacteroidetes bacterium GWF2_33_38]OFY91495.1 MAG: ABC transporter permease [Bacteroidetes bacterium RIFOXYA2_FULL_33_7]HBF88006.1 ABC transporter permease [Bacteroidales bacterium]